MKISTDRIARAAYISPGLVPLLAPDADFWRDTTPIHLRHDALGNAVAGNDTEVRIAWTDDALHLLFHCQYEQLHLLEGEPIVDAPTAELWNHDVAEIFIAAGADAPTRYAEFEISPRAEWIALDIETEVPGKPVGKPLQANAHFAASIDEAKKIWLGMMEIPFAALNRTKPASGMEFRMNLFRSQGTRPQLLAWQPTGRASFHIPASFGSLILSETAKG